MKYFSKSELIRCAAIGAVVAVVAVVTASSAGAAPAATTKGKAADSFGWQFDYDDADRVARITDPAGRDTRMQYSFDAAKRLRKIAQIRAAEPSVTREFDDAGRLQSMTDGAGGVAYGYDERGRLNRVQRHGGPAVTYAYDTRDQITRLQVGDFYRVEYTYDFLGRLASMKTPAGVVQYDYATGQGSVVRTLPNGIKTIWEYEPNGRLRQITHADTRNAILAQYTYQYRADGRIVAIREVSGGQQAVKSYEYDVVGRLVKASGPSGQHTYEYDVVGNRTRANTSGKPAETYTYDWAGRLKTVDGIPTDHDAAGNLTSVTIDGSTRRYRHNQDGQLAEVVDPKVTYRYDGDGNLIGRNVGGVETTFVPDSMATIWRPLVMTDKGGQRTLIVWEGDIPLMMVRDGKPEFLLHDHLGSVRAAMDVPAGTVSYRDYDTFGAPTAGGRAGVLDASFGGLFVDGSTGGYLTRARILLPKLARFLQPDPIWRAPDGSAGSLSSYAYSGGDSLNYVDRDGAERVAVTSNSNQIDWQEIYKVTGYARRVDKYIEDWVAMHGPGPVDVFVMGMTMRWEEGQAAAESKFPGKRVIAIPSYESLGVMPQSVPQPYSFSPTISWYPNFSWYQTYSELRSRTPAHQWQRATKMDLPKEGWAWWLRYSEDFLRTLIDRAKPDRNLDLPHVWSRLEALGCPVVVSFHESGALHDLLKNVAHIVEAARRGQRIPYLVPTSGAIGEYATMVLRAANVGVHESISHDNDVVKLVQTPSFELGYQALGWDLSRRSVGADVVGFVVGLEQKLFSGEGYVFKELYKNLPLGTAGSVERSINIALMGGVPGWQYNTDYHAGQSLYAPLRAIQDQKHREFQGKAVRSDSSRQVPGGRGPEKPKLSEPRRRDDLPRREDPPPPPPRGYLPPPPPPPPPPPAPSAGVNRAFAQYSTVYPSRVGGVYLAGAGQSLAGTGLLEGIAFDRNNNLVLVGKGGSETKLPPLRVDDVVTIFRSVYLHGEGPTVTIDPSPENPEGSAMIIRHGKATENTYVGWVLYQADRLMKGHTLGIDNITTKQVTTSVPGYADVLNTIYFGGENPEKLRKQGHWERFWIVPAATRRYVAPKKELTLFDVPLEVKTQSMKWEKGALVDDVQAKSSPGALAFRQWFTANYDRIAGERFLTPPKESGISAPVPVFTELRRIALITAIAERLRDQGVPLPFWMRDYDVRPVPFEKITPGLEVKRSKSNVIARVYGGVNLSAADKDVKTYTAGREAPPASGADAVVVRQHLTLAGALEEAIRPVTAGSEPMQVRALAHEGTNYQVASLPGAGTLALAPARLQEVDLMAPVPGRAPIRLVRSYNSFFNPGGPWGKGWALDLPRLDQLQLPVRRSDKGTEYQIAFELVTPLNSVYARFSRVDSVPDLNSTRLQVPDEPGEFFGVADGRPEFLSGPTQALLRKDGGTWHFSKSGELVATEHDGSRVVYERDGKGRVTRVVGLLGRRPVATIELRYDAAGRIEAATAKAEQREEAVRYEYDNAGRLAAVVSDAGRVGYRYDGSLLTEVTSRGAGKQAAKATDTVVRRFQYGPRGRLLAEFGPDGAKTEYRVTTDKNGSAVTAVSAVGKDKNARADTIRYDPTLRPVEAAYADGTKVAWSYPPGGGIAVDLKAADGANVRLTEAADQRSRAVELDANRKLAAQYDPAGRLTALADNGQPVLRQTWTANGRLLTAGDDTAAANFEYDQDGLVARVLLAPPGERGPFKTWQATRLDPSGRPVEVTDYRGMQASIDYDGKGELRAAVVKRDGKNYGFEIGRDEAGRTREVKSSWGTTRYAYDGAGLLSKLDVEAGGEKSSAEWQAGRLQKVRQFDGGEYSLAYYQDQKRAGLPKTITAPNRLVLAYDYDAANRLSQVAVGTTYRLLLDYDPNGRVKRWAYAAPKQ